MVGAWTGCAKGVSGLEQMSAEKGEWPHQSQEYIVKRASLSQQPPRLVNNCLEIGDDLLITPQDDNMTLRLVQRAVKEDN